jgi:hypothetical protein
MGMETNIIGQNKEIMRAIYKNTYATKISGNAWELYPRKTILLLDYYINIGYRNGYNH